MESVTTNQMGTTTALKVTTNAETIVPVTTDTVFRLSYLYMIAATAGVNFPRRVGCYPERFKLKSRKLLTFKWCPEILTI